MLAGRHLLLILLLAVSGILPAQAEAPGEAPAQKFASIIIDDLGNSIEHGHDIATLPAALTLAILPDTAWSRDIARLGKKHNKEIMLHLPLQSVAHSPDSPGTLHLHMTEQAFVRQLRANLAAVPYIRGVNNHMGSLLTRHPGHMRWLMQELAKNPSLYFVDSKTTPASIADRIATEHHIPNLSRDFFLDPDYSEATLQRQFQRFIDKVHARGHALAIAHPHPKTIEFLRNNLSRLQQSGIELVPVSELLRRTQQSSNKGKAYVTCTGSTCTGL